MDPATRLTVDLDALAANLQTLRAHAPGAEVAPVVKADAYGLGILPVAQRLWADGARRFFVARVHEGVALRQALGDGRRADILVLDGCPPGAEALLTDAGLTPVLSTPAQIARWTAVQPSARLAIHVDTGMNRLGLSRDDVETVARAYAAQVALVMTHPAGADTPGHPLTPLQAARLADAATLFPSAGRSFCNSAGLFNPDAPKLDVVRPGVSLYGGGPFGAPDARIRAVATLETRVLQVRTVRAGETIGYGGAYTASETLRVAVLAAGYADGVLRSASPGAYAWLDGRACAYLGRVSMDLIAVDASEAGGAREGSRAELFGVNVPVDTLASVAGTIAYEVLVRAGPRAERAYRGRGGGA